METKFLKQSKINFSKEVNNYYPEILTDEALNFLTALHEKFNKERLSLLESRNSTKGF
jgi:malate synthase